MQTQVLIIGGGATGTSIARDLALRGVHCILVEKDDINAGASGGNHGLLHSGARYVSNDQEAAIECREEGELLKRLAPQCVEETGGLFVAVEGDDENFIADFPGYCSQCNISSVKIDAAEALNLEPVLSKKCIAAYKVKDASIDPFKLSLESINHAITLGSALFRRTEVIGFEIQNNKIVYTRLFDKDTGKEIKIEAEQVINAAGAWVGEIAGMADISIHILYSKGTLLITNDRISQRTLNRLRPPSNADILVPGGTVSIIGTTSVMVDTFDKVFPTVEETDLIVNEGAAMAPVLNTARFIRAYSGVRPLFGESKGGNGRKISRGIALLDHEEDNLENFVTITGGKLTTCRLMAEQTSDLVCKRLNVTNPCITRTEPLLTTIETEWTEPGFSPKQWMKKHESNDIMLCECEMVPKSAIDNIVKSVRDNKKRPTLVDISSRSRIGKGTCQGSFCGTRSTAYLYDKGELKADQGLIDLMEFYSERWKGIHSILWGEQIAQAELMEAIHCGLFSKELYLKNKRKNNK